MADAPDSTSHEPTTWAERWVGAIGEPTRADQGNRLLYQATKRELAAREWVYVQDYADAKDEIVEVIIARALAGRDQADPALTSSAPIDTVRERT